MQAFRAYNDERVYWAKQDLERNYYQVSTGELQKLGFSPDASAALAEKLFGELHWKREFNPEALQNIVRESGANWKRAENTISSKDYWEKYFQDHPDIRPKHIIYYDGSPTSAVLAFEQKNGIGSADTSASEGNLLGFDDHHVVDMETDPRANRGYDELVQTAEKIIAEKYANTAKSNEIPNPVVEEPEFV